MAARVEQALARTLVGDLGESGEIHDPVPLHDAVPSTSRQRRLRRREEAGAAPSE